MLTNWFASVNNMFSRRRFLKQKGQRYLSVPVLLGIVVLLSAVTVFHGFAGMNSMFSAETCLWITVRSLSTKVFAQDVQDENYVPVLLYHSFKSKVTPRECHVAVTPEEFAAQMSYLINKGYKSISLTELTDSFMGKKELPPKPFIVTMDDGCENNYQLAYPILCKYNIKATIFVIPSRIGTRTGNTQYLTWRQAKEMEDSGLVEVHNHSLNHLDCSAVPTKELVENAVAAQELIESNLGERKVRAFAFPYGRCSELGQKELAKAGFKIQMVIGNGAPLRQTGNQDLTGIKRINVQHGLTGSDVERMMKKYGWTRE